MAVDDVRHDMDIMYEGFLCSICDGKNHQFIIPPMSVGGTGSVTLNAEWCQNTLKNHQKSIRLFNIRLINYLKVLQNVVDCNHYLKSYDLSFFEKSKDVLAMNVDKCLKSVASPVEFKKNCQHVCSKLSISKINWLIEGDFEFMIDAINLFEKFFEFKESGNFISMKLRMFFKKFLIPRKLTKTDQDEFYQELKRKENRYN